MNSKVLHLLNNLKEYSEKVTSTIEELRKVDWSDLDKQQATEADIGKLCEFWDCDLDVHVIGVLEKIHNDTFYPFYNRGNAWYRNCKRLTVKEWEGLV